ncbi:restriction endonuclease subunit S [Micromonospora vinacea]|uniref:restriction endonuclease subunit S n=1 Tax=Micromonospora vinacea TaxID=709878 RepID=UPI003454643B
MSKLKYLASEPITNGLGEAGVYDLPEWPRYIRTTDIENSRTLRDDVFKSLPPEVARQALLKPGDLLMTAVGATIGKSYLHRDPNPACYAGYLVRFRPANDIDARFIAYWAESKPYWDQVSAGAARSTIDNFSAGKYRNLVLSVPELEEQRRIADFLDAETVRIDRLIHLRTQQTSLHAQALMARATQLTGRLALRTGGTSRQFGVPLRRAIRQTQTGTTPDGLKEPAAISPEDRIPWYTPAALGKVLSIGDADKYVDRSEGKIIPRFPAGSILVTGIGESLGKVGFLDHDATGNQQLTALEPNEKSDGRFLAWQLWASQEEIRNWAQFSRVRIINNDALKSFPIHLPPKDVQVSVSNDLSSQLDDANRIRHQMERVSFLLSERRQALITAAVTGQIDVSTASGRGIED